MSEADGVEYVVRGDGTLVEIEAAISPKQEFREFLKLFKDWRMLALFPMFFSSNYCESKELAPAKEDIRLTISLRIPRSNHRSPLQRSYTGPCLSPHRSRLIERSHSPRSTYR